MDVTSRKEVVFFYESIRANPNGDPGFDNQPRMYPDNTVMVTDVRIKRTIRDYAKKVPGGKNVIFVDNADSGEAVTAEERAIEILENNGEMESSPIPKSLEKKDANSVISVLLRKTFDVPLFGALVPLTGKDSGSARITGPCQFGMGKSVNEAEIITNQISSHFVGDKKKRHGTFGVDHVIDYALIKTIATINPANLELANMEKKLSGDDKAKKSIESIKANFADSESKLLQYLWVGTNDLISRSKFRQLSILAVEVEYDRSYGDLDTLIGSRDSTKERSAGGDDEFGFEGIDTMDASKDAKHHATDLSDIEFGFKRLSSTLEKRSQNVRGVRIVCDPRIDSLVEEAVSKMPNCHAEKVNLSG